MTQIEFDALKATMPWRTVVERYGPIGGLVRVLNCNNQEVPMFDMTGFLEIITERIAMQEQSKTQKREQ